MRTLIRFGVILLLTALMSATSAWPASAKGADAVVILDGGSDRTRSASRSEATFGRLESAVGFDPRRSTQRRPAGLATGSSHAVQLIWLLGVGSTLRVDRIYLDGDDVWIATGQINRRSGELDHARWFRPADRAALRSTLAGSGGIPSASDAPARSNSPIPAAASTPPLGPVAPAGGGGLPAGLGGLGWGVLGLVLGAAGMFLFGRLRLVRWTT